jgi:hypothetical protein
MCGDPLHPAMPRLRSPLVLLADGPYRRYSAIATVRLSCIRRALGSLQAYLATSPD